MLTDRNFESFVFPWLIFDNQGKMIKKGNGCLFPVAPELLSFESEDFYKTVPAGWSRCPRGYAVYCVTLPALFDYRLVVPGLKVTGVSTVSGRSEHLSIKTDAKEIERYVAKSLQAFESVQAFFQNLVERSVHEVRSINRDVKAAAEDIGYSLGEGDFENIRNRTNNIKALSEILGSRADFLDYLTNPNAGHVYRIPIRVYQKFDKTVRSLARRAADRGIQLEINGNSVGQIDGLPVFEVIPYLLVENAIKYSPSREQVTIGFRETAKKIHVVVQNVGPHVLDEELDRLSEFGFRSQASVAARISGSGVGLFFVRDLVERHHAAKFKIRQVEIQKIVYGVRYAIFEIHLEFDRVS